MDIELMKGNIASLELDAIVNAANASLMAGGGVDAAIRREAGDSVERECREWVEANGPLPTGDAMITRAGALKCRYIIHTVGPIYSKGKAKEHAKLLGAAYRNCLDLALDYDLASLAFPNISTGVYGFPKAEAAEIALGEVRDFLEENEGFRVVFCCFDEENFSIYQHLL